MNKNAIIDAVKAALAAQELPAEEIEGQPGLQWFMPMSQDYENDYALAELFFASDLTDSDMNGIDLAQINLVFKREIDPAAVGTLRAFFAKVNRLICGGRFDAQQEESCFAEYGHDLILPLEMGDEEAVKAVTAAIDLANAYVGFVYEGVNGICAGQMTVDLAMDATYRQE